MPRGDRRGPEGFGPMTGRGYGYCAGYGAPGYAAPAPGRGMGRGGRGRAWGHGGRYGRYGGPGYEQPQPDRRQELDALKRQAEHFERGLEQVKSRIDELENDTDEE